MFYFKNNVIYSELMFYVNVYKLGDKILYFLVDGFMFNLIVGYGDSINVFDVILVVMVVGIGYIVNEGVKSEKGLYLLLEVVWKSVF